MTVELLSKPACVQCNMTKRSFDKNGLEYSVTDLVQDANALALAKELGHMSAPVVLVKDADGTIVDHWSGFQPEKIAAIQA